MANEATYGTIPSLKEMEETMRKYWEVTQKSSSGYQRRTSIPKEEPEINSESKGNLIREIAFSPEIIDQFNEEIKAMAIGCTDEEISLALGGHIRDIATVKSVIADLKNGTQTFKNRQVVANVRELCSQFPAIKKTNDQYNFERRLIKLGYPGPIPSLYTVKRLNFLGGSFEIIFEDAEDNASDEPGHGVQQPGHTGSELDPYIPPKSRRRATHPATKVTSNSGSIGLTGTTGTAGFAHTSTQLEGGAWDNFV